MNCCALWEVFPPPAPPSRNSGVALSGSADDAVVLRLDGNNAIPIDCPRLVSLSQRLIVLNLCALFVLVILIILIAGTLPVLGILRHVKVDIIVLVSLFDLSGPVRVVVRLNAISFGEAESF